MKEKAGGDVRLTQTSSRIGLMQYLNTLRIHYAKPVPVQSQWWENKESEVFEIGVGECPNKIERNVEKKTWLSSLLIL